MKQSAVFLLLGFSILSVACQPLSTPAAEVTPIQQTLAAPTTTSIPPTQTPVIITNMKEKLKELGGTPCQRNKLLTCVTITVPLDHFDPASTETIKVVFGVAPARGERKGMYVQALGGPGGEGISQAWLDSFPPEVKERYDIVYYDQRGVGLSSPLECKNAFARYFLNFLNTDDSIGEEGFDTPKEQQTASHNAEAFVGRYR